MLKILIIPAFRLYPVDSGGAHAQLAFLEKMQDQHEMDIIISPDNIDTGQIPAFREKFPKLNLLLTGYDAAKENKLAAFFKKLKRKMSGKDHAYQTRKYGLLNGLIRTKPGMPEAVAKLAAAKNYDIIQAEHSINMGLVGLLPAGPKKVFVHHEISHSRIKSDMQSLGYSAVYADYISDVAKQLERNWLNSYDGVITLCKEDAELLQQCGVDVPVQIAQPFALFEDELKNVYDPSLSPRLLFAGGESHYPNKEGLEWFLTEVYPLVKKQQPECSIAITGNWSKGFKERYITDSSIQFAGFLPSLDEAYRNSILVVPVRIGSGVRIKVITALAHGVPVVGTALGLSGIPGIENGNNVFITDEAASFAEKTISLLKDQSLRARLSQQGFLLAQKGYGEAAFSNDRAAFYRELLGTNPR